MKKTYMIPTLQVVKIQPTQILAGSEKIGLGGSYNGSSTIEARGAGFSDSDDDWED